MDWILYLLEKFIHTIRVKLNSKNIYLNKKNIKKLDLGCGGTKKKGFYGIDATLGPNVDLEYNLENGIPFPDHSISVIYTSHFLEHLPDRKALFLFKEMARILKPKGKLTIIVPDFEKSVEKFLEMSEKDKWNFGWEWIFGNQKKDYEFHKTGFTLKRLKNILQKNNFKNIKIKLTNKGVPSIIATAIR